jgi:hypothetical protein
MAEPKVHADSFLTEDESAKRQLMLDIQFGMIDDIIDDGRPKDNKDRRMLLEIMDRAQVTINDNAKLRAREAEVNGNDMATIAMALLMSGNDIPLPEAKLQDRILKEEANVSEDAIVDSPRELKLEDYIEKE